MFMIPLTSPISIRLAARRACGLLMLLAAAFRASAVTPETPRPPHVLILSSYHHTYAWTDDIIAGIEESLSSNGTPVMFSHEFLDTKRHAETPAYYELMAGVLEHKLQERPADLLILSDNSAFNFAVTHRERLFSGIPVVFCGINNYTPAMREQLPRSAGVAEHKEMGASIDLMRRLHPRTRSIAIVSDATGTGQIDAALTRNAIEESGLQVIELSGTELTLNELLERVGNLPAHSLVFFCSFWRDRDGLSLPAPKVLARLTVAAPVPVYTHADTFLTGGVLGGVVAHGRHQGNLAGDMARRILHGEDPEAIPVVSRSNIPVFDLQALRRWKIDPRRLPPGALLINPPPPTLFQQHSVLVGVVLSSFVILLGFVAGLAFNIARRRRAEAEREKLHDQLIHSHKMESVGRLAGGVAHDFNNMLGVILGYTEIAQDLVEPGHPLADSLEEINKAASRSADLTRQLLTFARRQAADPVPLDLNATVDGMLQMLRQLIGEDVELSWTPGSNPGPIRMDPSQLDQILTNLCVNARDAVAEADPGRVTIETRLDAFDPAYCAGHPGYLPGRYLQLAVRDNGCGMPKETVARLFEPYFTTKEKGKGTGLGLATVYGIVKQNHGFIVVESEPGQGTVFRIYLPLYVAPTGESASAPQGSSCPESP